MRIRLSDTAYAACKEHVDCHPQVAETFRTRTRRTSKRRLTIEMPPIGWLILREAMAPHAYGPRGGFTGPAPLRAALQEISTRLNELARHPAMFMIPTRGWYPVEVLGFRMAPDDYPLAGSRETKRAFSPYPLKDRELCLLQPRSFLQQGFEMTSWTATSVGHDSEELREQLVFGCQVNAGRIESLDRA